MTSRCIHFTILFMASASADQSNSKIEIAYLDDDRYLMQNTFIINLFNQIQHTKEAKEKGVNFELKEYADVKQIEDCLSNGTCLAALDYNDQPGSLNKN